MENNEEFTVEKNKTLLKRIHIVPTTIVLGGVRVICKWDVYVFLVFISNVEQLINILNITVCAVGGFVALYFYKSISIFGHLPKINFNYVKD